MSERDDLFDVDPPEAGSMVERQGEDFFFEMSEEQPDAAAMPDAVEETAGDEEPPGTERSGSRRRLVPLLLSLLILLLGAGYLLLGDGLFTPGPAPTPKLVQKQPQKLKVPEREALVQDQAAVQEVVVPAEQVSGVSVNAQTEPAPTAAAADQAAVAATEQVVAAEPVAVRQSQPEPEPASAPAAATAVEAVPVKAPYLLQIGAYVLDTNLEQTLKTVAALGYQPLVSEGIKTVHMTRLRVGAYPEALAREKLRELKPLAPSAFLLAEGEQLALYAGSYYVLDRARVEADLLYQHQIHIDEETVEVAIPIKTVRFGAFSDVAAAESVAEKTKKAGLDVLVIRQGSDSTGLLTALSH